MTPTRPPCSTLAARLPAKAIVTDRAVADRLAAALLWGGSCLPRARNDRRSRGDRHRGGRAPLGAGVAGREQLDGRGLTPADTRALILSLRRLNRIRSLDPAPGLAVAEAAVFLSDLNDAVRWAGRRFPLTLGARGTAMIGGLVLTNASGTQVLRFGMIARAGRGTRGGAARWIGA